MALLLEDRVIVEDEAEASRLQQRGFGKVLGKKLELSLLEALYLMERESLQVTIGRRALEPKEILAKGEEEFLLRYKVYRDLRERGYIVKTGFKFGAHFRVYERGEFLTEHSKYLVHAVPENYVVPFPELSRAVRLAQGVKKVMVFAVVDDEGDITYYTVDRFSP